MNTVLGTGSSAHLQVRPKVPIPKHEHEQDEPKEMPHAGPDGDFFAGRLGRLSVNCSGNGFLKRRPAGPDDEELICHEQDDERHGRVVNRPVGREMPAGNEGPDRKEEGEDDEDVHLTDRGLSVFCQSCSGLPPEFNHCTGPTRQAQGQPKPRGGRDDVKDDEDG